MAHAARQRVEAMLQRVFARWGASAVYTPAGGGPPVEGVMAVPEIEDTAAIAEIFDARARQTRQRFAVLKSAVGARPVKGAQLVVDGWGAFTVREEATSTDRMQLIWVCVVTETLPLPPPPPPAP